MRVRAKELRKEGRKDGGGKGVYIQERGESCSWRSRDFRKEAFEYKNPKNA